MKSNIEEISKNLDAVRIDRDEKQSKLRNEFEAAKRKAIELEAALKEAEDPEEYKKLLNAKSENDNFIEFLKARNPNSFKPAITQTEYREINKTINLEVEKLQKEHAPKILKEVQKLVAMLDEYSDEAEAIESVRDKASLLYNNSHSSVYKTGEIKNMDIDPMFYFFHICREYFNHRSTIKRLKRAANKTGFYNPWANAEEARIYKELTRRAS